MERGRRIWNDGSATDDDGPTPASGWDPMHDNRAGQLSGRSVLVRFGAVALVLLLTAGLLRLAFATFGGSDDPADEATSGVTDEDGGVADGAGGTTDGATGTADGGTDTVTDGTDPVGDGTASASSGAGAGLRFDFDDREVPLIVGCEPGAGNPDRRAEVTVTNRSTADVDATVLVELRTADGSVAAGVARVTGLAPLQDATVAVATAADPADAVVRCTITGIETERRVLLATP